jgi:hypothetical protein
MTDRLSSASEACEPTASAGQGCRQNANDPVMATGSFLARSKIIAMQLLGVPEYF